MCHKMAPPGQNRLDFSRYPTILLTTGWTRAEVSISPLEPKLGFSDTKKIVEYDFDGFRPFHVYLRPKRGRKVFKIEKKYNHQPRKLF